MHCVEETEAQKTSELAIQLSLTNTYGIPTLTKLTTMGPEVKGTCEPSL